MPTLKKPLKAILVPGESLPEGDWQLRAIQSDDCLSYIAWNARHREALVIDPKREDWDAYLEAARELQGYLWLGVIDTHTHADHVSAAAQLAAEIGAPLIMHSASPSQRVHLRVAHDTALAAHSGPIQIVITPGHTPDGVTVKWGPFLFGGDTVIFGDTGRDDLPGGSPSAHYESLQAIKKLAHPETILLPGHDHQGGRASSWATQLKLNTSLTQAREDFVRDAIAFDVAAPKLLKESLRENFK